MHRNIRIYLNRVVSCFWILILGAFCLVVSCKPTEEKPPMGKEQLAEILLDINVIEAFETIKGRNEQRDYKMIKNKDTVAVYYKQIFAKHKVSEEAYFEAIEWYQKRPIELFAVYELILPKIDSIKQTLPQVN